MKNKDIRKSFEEQKAAQGADFIPVKDREVVALIAYLQRLGTDITKDNTK
jgi:cytochrome c oxidase cbb3-type subunit I/II